MQYLCKVDDIPEDNARGFEVEDTSLVAVNKDGQIRVFINWCPHLGIELNFMPDEFMDMDGEFLQCANHGALFQVDNGECIVGPCRGQSLKAVTHEIRDGEVWLGEIPQPW
jgi:nitrite reductase/ring-hydroxylating ferredoxin subunit